MTKPDLSCCLTELTDEEYEAAPSLSREAIQAAFSKFRAALACGYRRNATRDQRKAPKKAKAPDGVCYTPSEPLPVCRSHSLLLCSTSSESHMAIGRLMSRRLAMYLSGTPFDGVDYTKELSIDGLSSFIWPLRYIDCMRSYWKRGALVGYAEDMKVYDDWELWVCTSASNFVVVLVRETSSHSTRWVLYSSDLSIQDTIIKPKPTSLKEAKKAARRYVFKELATMLQAVSFSFTGNMVGTKPGIINKNVKKTQQKATKTK